MLVSTALVHVLDPDFSSTHSFLSKSCYAIANGATNHTLILQLPPVARR